VPEDRRSQAILAARTLLEEEGPQALTMRRLAEHLGIRAPSLYKHVRDKAELEAALIAIGFEEFTAAVQDAPDLDVIARAHRAWARAHPHLYGLMTSGPLPRKQLPEGVEERAAAPVLRALGGDEHRARAAWSAAHGLVTLELAGRFPEGADLDAAWDALVAAFGGIARRP